MSGSRIARIAVFAALIGAFGTLPGVSVPGSSVPISAQTLAVMLTGLMLVPVEAFAAGVLFLGALIAGLPLMPNGFGGMQVFSSPRGGFAIGFPVAALAVSLLVLAFRRMGADRGRGRQIVGGFVASVLGGIAVLYAFAVPVGAFLGDLSVAKFASAMTAFIPGDLLKAGIAATVAASAFRAAPYLRPATSRS